MQEEIHEKRSNQLCLYISNLDTMIDEKYLEEISSRFGTITKTHILRHGSQSKGVGFVCFNTVEEATRAVNKINDQWVFSKPIYVKFSNDTDEAKLATSTNRSSSLNSLSNTAHSSVMPMLPYPNHPTIFFVPTMIVPPVLHRFPQQTKQYTLSPSSPPTMIAPTITNTTTTAEVKRQPYPYTSVKSDD
ncbi:hypothetical protein I4U23_019754 [Adineta vaga]|nr:hypothetical protein I4U23_019754 [Adineta vaga]